LNIVSCTPISFFEKTGMVRDTATASFHSHGYRLRDTRETSGPAIESGLSIRRPIYLERRRRHAIGAGGPKPIANHKT
jgi:hypothetical protein